MADEIAEWLEGLGLGRYAQAFADNAVNFGALPYLTEEDLKEPGLALGHCRTLQAAVNTPGEDEVKVEQDNIRSPHPSSSGLDRRQLTVMFCDLVGSTAFSGAR